MVDITIYIEGGVQSNDSSVLTVDNSAIFRESFYLLFTQKLSPLEFNLKIQPFGSITRTKKMLEKIQKHHIQAVLLIDLDMPKENKDERLKRYEPFDTSIIFFMIQEMEAWILSQVDKIEQFGQSEGLIRKKQDKDIKNNALLKNIHPENIKKPANKLDTILRQYFDVVKKRNNKRTSGKRYLKAKDGPKLIGMLDLNLLMQDFDEAKRLIEFIEKHKFSS
jgi:hypothetical protein